MSSGSPSPRFETGTFDGVESPCARDAKGHVTARYSLIVASGAGRVSGPYDLGTAKKSPKAKKAAQHPWKPWRERLRSR